MILKSSTVYTRLFSMVTSASHYLPLTGATPAVSLSKNGAALAAAGGTVSEIGSGLYKIALTTTDTNTLGDLGYYITAASGDARTFIDHVQAFIFNDLSINASGQVSIASNIKTNQALNGFTFVMTNSVSHTAQAGLVVTAQRSLAGAGFAACANVVSELSNGCYYINLAASDLNAAAVMLRFTAAGADDLDIEILTQP